MTFPSIELHILPLFPVDTSQHGKEEESDLIEATVNKKRSWEELEQENQALKEKVAKLQKLIDTDILSGMLPDSKQFTDWSSQCPHLTHFLSYLKEIPNPADAFTIVVPTAEGSLKFV